MLALLFVLRGSSQGQTCDDWKNVKGWQGTYTLSASGQFVHNIIDLYTISETTVATVSMTSQTGGLCDQLRWQGPDLSNGGSANDSTQIMNGCVQGQYFTYDTLIGNAGYPSNSEIVVDATHGTFSFQPIPSIFPNHTIYSCDGGQQSQNIQWATAPANNWPINFQLPQQVGPLTISNYGFQAANRYAGYQDINWTWTFNLTPIFADYNTLTVVVRGSGSVTSQDGFIHCPGVCSHSYPSSAQVTLNQTPAQGSNFVTWSGACSGTGSCNVMMTQAQAVGAWFSPPLQFVAVTPCRVVDTRNADGQFGGPPLQGGAERSFALPEGGCNIPATAAAYSINVTVVPITHLSYLTAWPTGENRPVVSTMNSLDGRIKANAAIIPAGDNAAVSFYATDNTNLVVDINGYFVPTGAPGVAASQFYALPPCRVIDTRGNNGDFGGPYLSGGVARDFPIENSGCVPQGPSIQAYSFNVTAVPHPEHQILAYLTVWPQGQQKPLVSTLNNPTATDVANAAIVPAGNGGGISVFPSNDTDLVVDINGYFAPPGQTGLSLYPVAPCRVLDTRNNHGQPFEGELTVNVTASPCAPPNTSQAYVFNATVVPPGPMGYLTLWPDGEGQPLVSTLNALDGQLTSNMAIVPTNNGSIDAFASGLTHLVLDISSYFAP